VPVRGVSAPEPHPPFGQSPALDRFIPRELLDKLSATRGAAAERRVVTMLFCDIQGSTALAEQHDPEEWTEIVNAAFERMVRPVYKYEGTVARLMGDGLLAFFGAPIAHEDDPRRAVLAGLTIVDGLRAWRDTLPPAFAGLDVRVGINTGLVVVGAVGSDLRLEYSAIGDAINLAARMEQTAAPGTVQIAEETWRLVADQFEVEPLGGITVKGKAQPVAAYRVLRRAGDARRPTAMRASLVNRRMEWDVLERAFDALNDGRGGVVFLTGDAGLGKTRLFDEAAARLLPRLDPPGRLCDASAVSYETSQPYGLLVRLLRRPLGLVSGDPPARVRERIAAVTPDGEDRALLESLFGVAVDSGHELAGESFAAQLDACMERFWRARAAGDAGPLVLALDDLQWLDASSAERLGRLVHLTEDAPVLFLCAMRRDRRSPAWGLKETVARELPHRQSEVALHPLNDGESRTLLAGLLDTTDPPDALAMLILDKAEGNPLFLEEVVRHLIERGELRRAANESGDWVAASTTITLPDSLQSLLTARIDRLDEAARRVLQVAAVIGRHFRRSTLAALVDNPDKLDACLLELQRLELIREIGRLPEPDYLFNHSLTQEAVYNTILLRQRRALHLRVAEVIEAQRAANPAAVAAPLAHHFIEGDAPRRALPYLLLAGASALRMHAVTEAITAYDRALPVARDMPDGAADLLTIYTSRGRALELLSRFAEAKENYEELETLAVARGDTRLELEAVIGLGKLHANVTPFYDPARGRALMERAVGLAESVGDRVAEARILWNLVNIDRFDINSLDRAIANGERAVALARELELGEELAYLLNDLGELYGTVGRFERADVLLREARGHWTALGNEAMLADSLTSAAVWLHIAGDFAGALANAEEAYAITTRIDNIWGKAYSRSVRGEIQSMTGELGRALEDLTAGHDDAQRAGFVAGVILTDTFIAHLLLRLGDYAGAEARARTALALARDQLPQFAGICVGCLVWCLIQQGETAAAEELFNDPATHEETQQIFQFFDLSMATILLNLAGGRPDDAVAAARQAIEQLTDMGGRGWLPDFHHALATALIAAGQPDEAAAQLGTAIDMARETGIRAALWHMLSDATALAARRGDPAAGDLRAAAAAEIDYVAANLYPDALRAVFLAHPVVRRIREHG